MISIDVGFGNVKVVYNKMIASDKKKKITGQAVYENVEEFLFPAAYLKVDNRLSYLDSENLNADLDKMKVSINGDTYWVGKSAMLNNAVTVFRRMDFERQRVLILSTIAYIYRESIETTINVTNLALGLPLGVFYKDKEELIKAITGAYTINVGSGDKKFIIKSDSIVVFPQGIIAAMSIYNANTDNLQNTRIGIVDIGQKTIDCCVLNNAQLVKDSIVGVDYGVYVAYREIASYLRSEHNVPVELQVVPEYMGRVPEFASASFRKLANNILNTLYQHDWNFSLLDKIIFIGGGSMNDMLWPQIQSVFNEAIEAEMATTTVERINDGIFANSRGFYNCIALQVQSQSD